MKLPSTSQFLISTCMLLIGGGVLAAIVVSLGLVPIAASSGHLPITAWILDFASSRSISTHSQTIEVPELDEPGLVRLGAASYQSNCQWCHGTPGQSRPQTTAHMTPRPPDLLETVSGYKSRELFYVVKHGIKFTGMPGWPSQVRDDEVWSVVAFLEKVPKMTPEDFREHVNVQWPEHAQRVTATQQLVAERCAACHALDGSGRAGPRVPHLNGQNADYMAATLQAYAAGERASGVMQAIAARLSDNKITELSEYFADQPGTLSQAVNIDSTRLALPEDASEQTAESSVSLSEESAWKLITEGDPQAKIPSCVDCHGPSEYLASPTYPKLAGQSPKFLERQLHLFRQQVRGGTPEASVMHPIAEKLTDDHVMKLSEIYSRIHVND